MSTVVAVAGGSGGLGRAIVEALVKDERYKTIVLARKANTQLERGTGARVLAADYTNPDTLSNLLEEHNVSVVISTLSVGIDITPELNLISAAGKSKVTKRFVANIWGIIVYELEDILTFPLAGLRLQAQDALRKTNLEWTTLYPGLFLDYFVQDISTHLSPFAAAVDVKANVAALPSDGTNQVYMTYSHDIGKFVAAVLSLDKWDERYFMHGYIGTWKEVVATAEKNKGVKFDVSYDPIEKFQKGQVTELPVHREVYKTFGGEEVAKPLVQSMLANIGLWYANGRAMNWHGGKILNDMFPEIEATGLEEAWGKYYRPS